MKSVWASIYAEVREAYARIILDKKRLELAGGNLEVYRRFYSQVELRYQSGKAARLTAAPKYRPRQSMRRCRT